MNPVLVEVTRGSEVESRHRGALVVVDAQGRTVAAFGDTEARVYPRSAVKVLQALPLVASGAADRFGLSDAELALACASHNGQAEHAATALSMLRKCGLDESALECGAHWPYLDTAVHALAAAGQAPSALHNNCSGKHAGFACLGCAMAPGDARGFLSGYVQPDHAVMREVGAALEAATGTRLAEAPRGTDGCSIPTYALPLRSLALAFARVATGQDLSADHARAALRLRQAVARQPFMVAGTGRFDTKVMAAWGERVFCKVGAEGMYCAALPEQGLGVAIKMDDGNTSRACEVVMAAVIEAFVPLQGDAEATLLAGLLQPPLRNWRGTVVGGLRPTPALRELRNAGRAQ
jgi:L-asparaginase II